VAKILAVRNLRRNERHVFNMLILAVRNLRRNERHVFNMLILAVRNLKSYFTFLSKVA
jgi:hypothetical protein